MRPPQLLSDICRIRGVEGCYMATTGGTILQRDIPNTFDTKTLSIIALKSSHLIETFRTGLDGCSAIQLNMERKKLYVQQLDSNSLLVIIVESGEKMDNVTTAATAVLKSYEPSGTSQIKVDQEVADDTPTIFDAIFRERTKQKLKSRSPDGGM